MINMYVFVLPTNGTPFLSQNKKYDMSGTSQINLNETGVSIHPMFRKTEKWDIANTIMRNRFSKVYILMDILNAMLIWQLL